MTSRWRIEARATGRTFGVFGVVLADGAEVRADLLEGGFFAKAAADAAAVVWERACLQSEVEDAERAAGWDPNP